MILVLLRHKFAAARRAGVSVYVENANNGVAQWQPQKIKQLEMALRQNFYALRRKFYYKLNSDAIRSETEMTTKQYLGHNPQSIHFEYDRFNGLPLLYFFRQWL